MADHRYTANEYALQRLVESFGNLVFQLTKHHLTHTYIVVVRFGQAENIDYLVLRYSNTGTLPFEESSEEWSFDGKV